VRSRLVCIALLVVAAALSAGCMGDGGSTDDAFAGENTFEDDFGDDSNWPARTEGGIISGVFAGAYQMEFQAALRSLTVGPQEVFTGGQPAIADSVQSVDVRSETAESPTAGMLCRWNEEGLDNLTAYGFVLRTTDEGKSAWNVNRSVNNKSESLAQGTADVDLTQDAVPLEASCVGDTLTFRIDGEEVASVTDTQIESGINGLVGVTLREQQPPLAATFDNYVLEYDELPAGG
jgi:hypothetical protein